MATVAAHYIDDHDPIITYTPTGSWTRGGNVSDYQGTSTFTGTPGATASITFSGTGISVWGTITHFDPGVPTFVLSSYSVDGGPATTHSASEQPQFQFQQNFFQSGPLAPGTHTLVVTHLNNAALFIDYLLINPSNSPVSPPASPLPVPPPSSPGPSPSSPAPSSSLPVSLPSSHASSSFASVSSPVLTVSSPSSPLSSPSTPLPAVAGTQAANTAQSHSGSVPIGAIVGGLLGGLALIGIAVFVFWLRRRRVKNDLQRPPAPHPYPDPNVFFNPTITTEQYQPYYGGAYSVSTNAATPSQFSYPTPTSLSQGIIPPSKGGEAAQRYWAGPVPHENSSDSYTLYGSIEPPRYEQ